LRKEDTLSILLAAEEEGTKSQEHQGSFNRDSFVNDESPILPEESVRHTEYDDEPDSQSEEIQ
jgi:hypothetical protein